MPCGMVLALFCPAPLLLSKGQFHFAKKAKNREALLRTISRNTSPAPLPGRRGFCCFIALMLSRRHCQRLDSTTQQSPSTGVNGQA
jgi:hypothetical protein